MADKFGLDDVLKNIAQLKKELPPLIANEATRFFTATFQSGSWEGKKWKTPKRKIPGTKEYEYPKKKGLQRRTKPTLVKSGILRRAVSVSARVITWDKIQFVVDQPYAARHNEGLDGMPKRTFMAHSPELDKKIITLIEKRANDIWQV